MYKLLKEKLDQCNETSENSALTSTQFLGSSLPTALNTLLPPPPFELHSHVAMTAGGTYIRNLKNTFFGH